MRNLTFLAIVLALAGCATAGQGDRFAARLNPNAPEVYGYHQSPFYGPTYLNNGGH